jgi:undecaprenyl-diphosphatase
MLEALKQIDTQWFLWINSHHNTVLDWVLWTLSQHCSWAIVIVLFFCLLTLRHEPRRWWLVLAGVVLCFLLADQGSVHLFKETVGRLRPCHALEEVRMFRTHCGGQYGFVSSHAANSFAIVTFLIARYRRRIVPTILLTLWALATCYSRAYLGKHYPGDLVCGALFGVLIGLIVWWLSSWIEKKLPKGETK